MALNLGCWGPMSLVPESKIAAFQGTRTLNSGHGRDLSPQAFPLWNYDRLLSQPPCSDGLRWARPCAGHRGRSETALVLIVRFWGQAGPRSLEDTALPGLCPPPIGEGGSHCLGPLRAPRATIGL